MQKKLEQMKVSLKDLNKLKEALQLTENPVAERVRSIYWTLFRQWQSLQAEWDDVGESIETVLRDPNEQTTNDTGVVLEPVLALPAPGLDPEPDTLDNVQEVS